jgi:hypothetical protein
MNSIFLEIRESRDERITLAFAAAGLANLFINSFPRFGIEAPGFCTAAADSA